MKTNHHIDYIELFVSMAKPLVYWHSNALGFDIIGYKSPENGTKGVVSYLLEKGEIKLVITAALTSANSTDAAEVLSFVNTNSLGMKRVVIATDDVSSAFDHAVAAGGIPIRFPVTTEDEKGYIEEASIRLYDQNEIVFSNRDNYEGIFRPGYEKVVESKATFDNGFTSVDHIASELRINQIDFWTSYLKDTLGTQMIQGISKSEDNKTGLVLNINQSPDKRMTFVMAEPNSHAPNSKVQQNIDNFGPGIHHVAFATDDLVETVKKLRKNSIDFVQFPPTYYDLLRENEDLKGFDIDELEEQGILIDKEGDGYLLQKFIKPFGDRPFFFYELVQRVNGYTGFALKNINVLKKAEERQIMKYNAMAET